MENLEKTRTLRSPKIDKVNDVLATTDYNIFKYIGGNRHINGNHLERLMKSMESQYLEIPIIVNEKYEIIDGQHRATCCQQLGLPVYFIVCKGYSLKEVQIANSNTVDWKPMDFALSFAERGYKDYIEYLKFQRRYRLPHQINIIMLSGNTKLGNREIHHEFRQGLFKVSDINLAHSWAAFVFDFKDIYKGFKKRSFVYALLHVIKTNKYIHKEMVSKAKLQPRKLVNCPTQGEYIKMLEEVYNYKRSQEDKIRFF